MKRNITIIIVLSLAVSACCEKEGSFLGTIIKNRAIQITAAAQLESVINQESSTLNANAATVTTKNTQTVLISSQPDTAESTDLTPELQTITIKTNNITTQADQMVPENVARKTIETTDDKITDLKEPASQPEENVSQTVAKLNDIELDTQPQDEISTENQTIDRNIQETKDLTEVIDQSEEIIDLEQTIQTEGLSDRNARLLELLSKDIKKQADKTNSKVSQ